MNQSNKKWEYSLTTSTIWTSFDNGVVHTDSREEALEMAKKEITYNLEKANHVFNSCDVTLGFTIDMDLSQIELKEIVSITDIVAKKQLLAEFMGVFDNLSYHGGHYSWSDSPYYFTREIEKEKIIENIARYLKYDSDWNLLVEVVKKCYSLSEFMGEHYEKIYYSLADLNIEGVFNGCVSFVEHYNKNK
jgi:hypothetical protein